MIMKTPHQKPPDPVWMAEGILKGDENAFNRFYDFYVDRLYRYLIVVAPREEPLVREALQETMLRVLRHIKPFEEEAVLWGWLTRVAKSVLFDLLRKKKRTVLRERPLSREGHAKDRDRADDGEESILSALRVVLKRLPDEERALVDAYYVQGVGQAELASELGRSRKAVEGRLARLRKKMKTMILEVLGRERGS